MTDTPLSRRRPIALTPPPPAVDESALAVVAARNGFASVKPNSISAPVGDPAVVGAPRRQRQPTGRDHQFNTRLKLETLDFIYAQANGRGVPIAQVIEEMVEALKREQGRG